MAGKTLAGPPGDCCRQTVQHVGEPKGTVETIAGVETYTARPPGGTIGNKIILFFADVFGPLYVNSKLLMDYWAENGFLVLGLDYFEGDSYALHKDDKEFDVMAWMKEKQDRTAVLLPPWVEAVRKQYGPEKKYTCVGYCFGGPYVMVHVKTDWITAGAFAHPAFLNEDHFRNVKKPILLSCAEIDETFPVESRRRAEDILVEEKATYFIQVFSSVKHGFALRGNPDVSVEKWAKEESARGILDWFNHFCE
ncbi:Alpha/Beta hydrolase protein [Trametes polyzona]|nr:Alpha/Beta hydrolase protein [Trametes polyzona]